MIKSARIAMAALIFSGVALSGMASQFIAPGLDGEGCELVPISVDRSDEASWLTIARVSATSCSTQVEVNERIYTLGVGRFLDERKLELRPYGEVTYANTTIPNPATWSLVGVDPTQVLLIQGSAEARDNLGNLGDYMVLWGSLTSVPRELCEYADPGDLQYPAVDCPIRDGFTYEIELPIECGLGGVLPTPIGGEFWEVVEGDIGNGVGPPPDLAGGLDYGMVQRRDDGRLTYRSDQGPFFVLQRVPTPDPVPDRCEPDLGF